MPDYYTTDPTVLPYSALLWGGEATWSFVVRLILLVRKAVGWRFPPIYGRKRPELWQPLELDDLPLSLREDFLERSRAIESLGFSTFTISKSETIGYQVVYNWTLISNDRASIASESAIRCSNGTITVEVWASGFQTVLRDGTFLVTMSGPKTPEYLLRPQHHFEFFEENTPIAVTYRRHHDRLRSLQASQISLIPTVGVEEYSLRQGQVFFDDMLETGAFRKLTDREVEAMQEVEFDFE